jgi:hypothetical protein
MKVLLYVPEPIGRFLSAGLMDEGWEFIWTDNLVNAIHQSAGCDVMVVDCGLIPRSNLGLELPTDLIPTILLNNPSGRRRNGMRADAELLKPFRFQQLLDVLTQLTSNDGKPSGGPGTVLTGC